MFYSLANRGNFRGGDIKMMGDLRTLYVCEVQQECLWNIKFTFTTDHPKESKSEDVN
jgi:hypothetical protein